MSEITQIPEREIQSDDTQYYEPWIPTVGQRVRVRLSGECPGVEFGWGCNVSHRTEMDGQVATVRKVRDTGISGHRFQVITDEVLEFPGDTLPPSERTVIYAAIELEPLD